MNGLTKFGIDRSRVTLLIMLLLMLVSSLSYFSFPKREDPAITIRSVIVSAETPGLSPERMEDLVAIPIERKAREIGEIDDIRTRVMANAAIVTLDIADHVATEDLVDVKQDIRNKMATLQGKLPEGTQGPSVNTDYGDVVVATVAVTGEGFSYRELEESAKELQSKLYTLGGVAKVSLLGVQDERIWLEFDSSKLAAIGVEVRQLVSDLQDQNVILPAGDFDANGTSLILEANGDLGSVQDIENVLSKVPGLTGYVRIRDLLSVRRGYVEPAEKPTFFNGQPAIMVGVEMLDGVDVQALGRVIKQTVESYEQTQPIGISYSFSTYQESKVTVSVNDALSNVGMTIVVVMLVMLLFLGLSAALVIVAIVPFSVAISILGMTQLGIELEQVSIAAVIISLGLLVDNGLVVVEDIKGKILKGMPAKEAALGAGQQFFLPLIVASITTVSAFLPMMLLNGTEGEYANSLGTVVALMLLGSWVTAMYFLPALCVWMFKDAKGAADSGPNLITRLYGASLSKVMVLGPIVIVVCYLLVGVSGATFFPKLKNEMFPLSERDQFLVYLDMPKGTAISETTKSAQALNDWLMDESINPEIKNTTFYVGDGGPRFYLSLDPADAVNSSAFFLINTHDFQGAVTAADRTQRHVIEYHPEARFKIKRLAMGGSESGIVEVKLSGPDGETLLGLANQVESAFAEVPDIVQNENNWGNKVVKIVLNISQDRARGLGVTSKSISEVLEGYFTGTNVSTFREDDKSIPITLRAGESYRDSLEDLESLTISADGRPIALSQLARLEPVLEFSQIRRENQDRVLTVSAKSKTLSAQELLDEVQASLDALSLPTGFSLKIDGEVAQSADVYGKLAGGLPVVISVMLLALMVQFNSFRRVSLTLMTIPLVVIGAPIGLWLTGRPLSFFAVLGLISLAGIIINNAIVLIDQVDLELKKQALKEAIVTASMQRFRPIMLTSLTTVLGLTPMAMTGGALWEPMATIMIGGLIVASVLTLYFVPAGYYMLLRNWRKT